MRLRFRPKSITYCGSLMPNGEEIVVRNHIVRIALILPVLLVACRPSMVTMGNIEEFDDVVVEVGGRYQLTMSHLYRLAVYRKLLPSGGVLDTAQLRRFADSIVVDTLAGFEADSVDLKQYLPVYRTCQKLFNNWLLSQYFERTVDSCVKIDSQEVVDFYLGTPTLFELPEAVLVHHISIIPDLLKGRGLDSAVSDTITAEAVEEAMKRHIYDTYDAIDSAGSFLEVARRIASDSTAVLSAGLLGWTERDHYLPPFDSVTFVLDSGEYSQPYRDEDGWHVVYSEGYRTEGIPPLTPETYSGAYRVLFENKAAEVGTALLDSLQKEIEIEYHEEVLDVNVHLADREEWVALVNGTDTVFMADIIEFEEPFRREYGVDNTTPEMKKRAIAAVAQSLAALQATRAMGIDKEPESLQRWHSMTHARAKSIVINSHTDLIWTPSDSQIEAYYQEHIDEYDTETPLTVQHIVVEDSILGEFLRDQAMSGIEFLDLAEEYYPGEPDVRRELADLGDIGFADVSPEFYNAAMSTRIGEVSRPVKSDYGYHIIKVLARRETWTVARARPEIIAMLRKQRAEEMFRSFRDELYAKYDVTFPSRLYPVHMRPRGSYGGG